MGAPSTSPNGDFYFGMATSINSFAGLNKYAYSIVGRNNPATIGLPGSIELGSFIHYSNSYIVGTSPSARANSLRV